ncbi:MAG TPA: DUF2267 domain-containing protein [Pelomicrobium sp.]|nr:DUF2267 domain-containing protein [Pelomicrobium sp.]
MPEVQSVHVFDKMLIQANEWVSEIGEEMKDPDPQRAYHALRGTLFALRDRMPATNAAHLSAQLPTLVRGIFYDGYRFVDKPERTDREALLERVRGELATTGRTDAETAVGAVLRVMERRLEKAEMDKVKENMPKDIRALWEQVSA